MLDIKIEFKFFVMLTCSSIFKILTVSGVDLHKIITKQVFK